MAAIHAAAGRVFHQLAALIVPVAPDRSDAAIGDAVHGMADAMATEAPAALAAEVGAPIARVLAPYARLDALFADLVAHVERVFCRTTGAPPPGPIDAATRDRLLGSSPRARFHALANRLPALCRP